MTHTTSTAANGTADVRAELAALAREVRQLARLVRRLARQRVGRVGQIAHVERLVIGGASADDEPALAETVPTAPVDERGRTISQIPLDILKVLADAGRPLTTTQLLSEMAKAGMEWSQRRVSDYLAEMVRDGTLENPEGAKPRGYRLPAQDAPL